MLNVDIALVVGEKPIGSDIQCVDSILSIMSFPKSAMLHPSLPYESGLHQPGTITSTHALTNEPRFDSFRFTIR